MNQYETMREPIGTPEVQSTLTTDLYLSIMNIDPNSQTVSVLLLITPMVSWIWIAVFMMGIGGLIALIPMRRVVILSEAKDLRISGTLATGDPSPSLRSGSG